MKVEHTEYAVNSADPDNNTATNKIMWTISSHGMNREIEKLGGDRKPGNSGIACQCKCTATQVQKCLRDLDELREERDEDDRELRLRKICQENGAKYVAKLFSE